MKARKSAAKKRSSSHAKKARRTVAKKSAKKTSARKAAARKSAAVKSSNPQVSGGHAGNVYVFAKSGTKAKKAHVAEKATASQIRKALGISDKRIASAKSLIKALENKGRISRVG